MVNNTEIVIIGGGPAGYVAALRASQLGAKVAVVENRDLGGTCLNRGCIPTKALLQSTEVFELVKNASRFGVTAGEASIDFAKAVARKNAVVKQLVTGVNYLLKSSNVEVINATASFTGKNEVELTKPDGQKEKLTARKFIIASGSVPAMPPIPGIDSDGVITSDKALEITAPPKSMVIIGGGVIGVEFATIFASVGTKVTIIEMMPRLIPNIDAEVAETLKAVLKRQGIAVYLNSRVESIDDSAGGKVIEFVDEKENRSTITADKVLVSVGRRANIEGLGLEKAGIRTERGSIVVNEHMETNVPNIYAAGDVTGGILLAHVAFEEGKVAAENALGHEAAIDYKVVPSGIFTRPEIGSVGLSEEEAKQVGHKLKIGRFPFRANGKALAMNESEGFVKIIADTKYGEILGVHIIGPHATDLIHEAALAIKLEATLEEIANTIHAHPTLAETMVEAALDADKIALHIPNKR
ncbi:MAG: dihydrolipoamide dehydrogenase [Thermosediminibacterales bacterium]|nr:dihydrolipoamide dehydrogenase [Thermosediminibacterales bacterium]